MAKSKLGNGQSGAAGVLVTLMVLGACLLTFGFLSKQASTELDTELHHSLHTDKIQVRTSLKWNTLCQAKFANACTKGKRLPIYARDGKLLVSTSGRTEIGNWNVRLMCNEGKLGRKYYVQLARRGEKGEFLDDPLTKAKLKWTNFFPITDLCESGISPDDTIESNVCYGNVDGIVPLPPDLAARCPGCGTKEVFSCGDDQVAFPACPAGYRVGFQYVDRYGWAGIDLSKITICKKI